MGSALHGSKAIDQLWGGKSSLRFHILGCTVFLLPCMHMVVVVCGCWLKGVMGSMGAGGTLWQVALGQLPRAWQRMVVGEGGMPAEG